MTTPLLIITIFIYSGVALDYILKGNKGMALAFLCYALANVGFIIANRSA